MPPGIGINTTGGPPPGGPTSAIGSPNFGRPGGPATNIPWKNPFALGSLLNPSYTTLVGPGLPSNWMRLQYSAMMQTSANIAKLTNHFTAVTSTSSSSLLGGAAAGAAASRGGRGGGGSSLASKLVKGAASLEAIHIALNPLGPIAALENIVIGASRDWMKFRLSAFNLGRISGSSGQDIQQSLMPGKMIFPEWLRGTGYGQIDAMSALQRGGIGPFTPSSVNKSLLSLGYFSNYSPGFARTGPEGTEEYHRLLQGLGIGKSSMGGGALPIAGMVGTSNVLSAAAREGKDDTKLLEAIKNILSDMEKTATGIDMKTMLRDFFGMTRSGVPGANTGAAQVALQAGMGAAFNNAPGRPDIMLATTMAMNEHGGVTTASQFYEMTGLTPGSIPEDQVNEIVNESNPVVKMLLLQKVLAGNGPAAAKIQESFIKKMIPGASKSRVALALSQDVPFPSAQAFTHRSMGAVPTQINGVTTDQYNQMFNSKHPDFLKYDSSVSDDKYQSALIQTYGFSPDEAQAIIDGAKNSGRNPMALGALRMKENPKGVPFGVNPDDEGLMQINRKTSGLGTLPRGLIMSLPPTAQYQLGGNVLGSKIAGASTGETNADILADYHSKTPSLHNPYRDSLFDPSGMLRGIPALGDQGDAGVAADVLKTQQEGQRAALESSRTEFENIAVNLGKFNDGIRDAIPYVHNFTNALGEFLERWRNRPLTPFEKNLFQP